MSASMIVTALRSNRLCGAVCASLAVNLGLGLVYLYAGTRAAAFTVIAAVLATAFLTIVLAALADVAADERRRSCHRLPGHHS